MNIVGYIISLVSGFFISLLFFIKGKNRKHISYSIDTFCLVSNKISKVNKNKTNHVNIDEDKLNIKYNSIEIENLYSSTITIKNIGSVINSEDFAPNSQLSLSTNGQFILNEDKDISLKSTNKANNVSPVFNFNNETKQCNSVSIKYDYLAKKEEITCTLLHTNDIIFNGTLKDGKITYLEKNEKQFDKFMIYYIFPSVLVLSIISFILDIIIICINS